MKYALINNGIVLNVIDSDAEFAATIQGYEHVIASEDAQVGWSYDGNTLSAPTVPPAPEPVADARVTRLAFRNRFTQPEKVALELAALDDPSAAMAQRQQAAALRVYLADVDAATFIDLSRPDTMAGVQALEAMSLIAAGRADEILMAEIQPHERPL